jgi:hypothetical protein
VLLRLYNVNDRGLFSFLMLNMVNLMKEGMPEVIKAVESQGHGDYGCLGFVDPKASAIELGAGYEFDNHKSNACCSKNGGYFAHIFERPKALLKRSLSPLQTLG